MKIKIILGDISKQDTGAIVNPANKTLLGGGGADGAIHHAAGPKLLEKCKSLNGCEIGEAKITEGYNLKAKYIIHTVGPRCYIEGIDKLKDCYMNSLKLAEEKELKSISFPAISTGAYGCPIEKSAKIVGEVLEEFKPKTIEEIRFVLFSEKDLEIYKKIFIKLCYKKEERNILI